MRSQLNDAKIEFQTIRGLEPGRQTLLVRDPAGNWLGLVEYRQLM
jgi:extradiol dioxygenase family protein